MSMCVGACVRRARAIPPMTVCVLLVVLCVAVDGGGNVAVEGTSTTIGLGAETSARVSSQFTTVTVVTTAPQEAMSTASVAGVTVNASTLTPASERIAGDSVDDASDSTSSASADDDEDYDLLGDDVDRPLAKIAANISQNLLPLPAGASAALVKPTKYHYYPHNQHIYLLPECAIQQVCNAVYVRLNWTQPLCACPSRYRDPCSASLNSDDLHTTELVTSSERKQQQQQQQQQRALTLIKTCEPTSEMRACRRPRDWSLLALQNVRTGKSHYLVICRCPDGSALDGPMSHDQPTYASVPGIRVYGMMCVQTRAVASSGQPGEHSADTRRRGRPLRVPRGTAAAVKRIARRMSRDVLPEAATVPPVDR